MQAAFVEGKQILDAILVVSEVVGDYLGSLLGDNTNPFLFGDPLVDKFRNKITKWKILYFLKDEG